MLKILTSAQMREVDRLSTEQYAIPSLFLMENAGVAVAAAVREACPDWADRRIAIVCGKGNNGGDGFAAARQFRMRGVAPEIYLIARKDEIKGDARVNLDILDRMQVPVMEITSAEAWQAASPRLAGADIILDGLLGTGLSKPVSGLYEEVIQTINRMRTHRPGFIVAIDIPSGLAADSPTVPGAALRADLTVTFTAPKPAHIFAPACTYVGRMVVAPIGSPEALLARADYYLNLITADDVRQAIPRREPESHKGTYGHVLVVAGSVGKTGAAAMAGWACLKSGAGLVTIATAQSAQAATAAHAMELMTEGVAETDQGTISESARARLFDSLEKCQVLALGPGLSTHPSTVRIVHELVQKSPVPVIVDADGINAFDGHLESLHNENGQVITLTPHPGEMARLLQKSVREIQAQRIEIAQAFARDHGVILVLKGYRTLIAAPTGAVYVSPTGNPGMATAGAGDVLTGMVASLMVNRTPGAEKDYARAAAAAVYLHGLAGDRAAEQIGQEALTASDIIAYLPEAMKALGR